MKLVQNLTNQELKKLAEEMSRLKQGGGLTADSKLLFFHKRLCQELGFKTSTMRMTEAFIQDEILERFCKLIK